MFQFIKDSFSNIMGKKKERPSPSESATKFAVGKKKKGGDGNMWEISVASNGVKRWKKCTSGKTKTSAKPKTSTSKPTKKEKSKPAKKSKTMTKKGKQSSTPLSKDNPRYQKIKQEQKGSKPYKIANMVEWTQANLLAYVSKDKVTVYQQAENITDDDKYPMFDKLSNLWTYTKLVKKYTNCKKIYLGKSPRCGIADVRSHSLGNSILIQVNDNKYACVLHDSIMEFELAKGDKVLSYTSPYAKFGPEPMIIGKNCIYWMIEGGVYMERKHLPDLNALTEEDEEDNWYVFLLLHFFVLFCVIFHILN